MYSNEIRDLVNDLRGKGFTYSKISELVNLSLDTVRMLIRYRKKAHKQKTGRKFLVDKRLSLRIKRYVSSENIHENKVNCRTIIQGLDLDISRKTINNFLLRNDFKYRKQVQHITLSKQHKQERVQLVSDWIHGNIDWSITIFSDEKKFNLDGSDNW